jgi:AsmA family protein
MIWSRRLTRLAAGLTALLLLAPPFVLAGADAGLLDSAIKAIASAKARRPVGFTRLNSHLLSARPSVSVEGLWISSPPAITREPLLRAPLMTVRLRFLPLLVGRLEPIEIVLTRPQLHLVRLRPGVTNIAFGRGQTAGFLGSTRRLTIIDGVVALDDVPRQATLLGVFSQRDRPGDPAPFRLAGRGVIKDGAYTVIAEGAALNGRPAGAPYPFSADIRDGDMTAELTGTSGRPFQFRNLDLAARASGPNLAAVGYLFGFHAPNSAPFQLTGRIRRNGSRVEVSDISGRVGRTDIKGAISSERRQGRAALTKAHLISSVAYLSDLRALLRARAAHAVARAVSGAEPPPAPKRSNHGLSSRPFDTQSLAKADLQIDFQAAQLADAPLPVRRLAARVAWSGGHLAISPVSFDTTPGRADLSALFDFASDIPTYDVRGSLEGARLAALSKGLGRSVDGKLDAAFDLSGQGRSPHAMAIAATGRAAFRLTKGQIQRTKAAVLSGDLVDAVGSYLGAAPARAPLYCAVGEFAAAGGRLQVRRLDILTSSGLVSGSGDVDIADGSVSLVLKGTPTGHGPHVRAPIAVQGPLGHPAVKLAAAPSVHAGGVARAAAVVKKSVASIISPPPPATLPSCSGLLAEAASYVGSRRGGASK